MTRTKTVVLFVATLALTACQSNTPDTAAPVVLGEQANITVDDGSGNFFDPAHAVVRVGTTVTWEWAGNRDHNVVGEGFASEAMRAGTFAHTFDEPGVYAYTCTLHGNMDGVIEVTG